MNTAGSAAGSWQPRAHGEEAASVTSSPWSDPTNHCSDGNGLHQAEGSRGGCHRTPALFSMLIPSCARASCAPESNPLQSTTHDLPTDGYMESMMRPVPVRCKHNREVPGWWCRASQPSPQVEHIRAHTTGSSSSIHRRLQHWDHGTSTRQHQAWRLRHDEVTAADPQTTFRFGTSGYTMAKS